MPRRGMERQRRQELVEAAIAAIHETGSLDVTVGQIARRAGVSSALAHHYFGGKDDLIVATMRHLMSVFAGHVRRRLRQARSPRARLSAIIQGSFTADQLQPAAMSAWLVFYAMAQASPGARRLHHVYTARLHSTLVDALAELVSRPTAYEMARGIAALIDGIYLRCALGDETPDTAEAVALVEGYVEAMIGGPRRV
ncbi:MAG: transcriptional regulator BetI [Hyphomicrobiaceae bacterium]